MKKAALVITIAILILVVIGAVAAAELKNEQKSDDVFTRTKQESSTVAGDQDSTFRDGRWHTDALSDTNNRRSGSLMLAQVQAPQEGSGEFRRFSFMPGDNDSHGFKARLMVMYRLVEHLDLNEETATKFFPIYLAYINERDKFMKEHRDLIMQIADGAENNAVSVKELKAKVEEMRGKERKLEAQRNEFFAKAEKILDERQYIKLVVFNDKLKEDLIMQFRSERMFDGKPSDIQMFKSRDDLDKSKTRTDKK